ncbi:hypothetical protein [Haliangium ochraceum]|uniref:Lipoprotein n=1 Tax=Haliangium ochraceum (strain DSM 14365 / JCM 11303 / SMP-2) TaxID=502025 RepID=D0LW02_HALO1|nr:hypothetical protein [Haliangium ochraceum]ACY14136.1 conserved hypothetical protein [Haliangium ochraceum DSM 14365]
MNTRTSLLLALSLMLAACGTYSEEDFSPDQPEDFATAEAQLAGFQIDSRALEQRPSGQLPEQRLPPEAFEPQIVASKLVGTNESFNDAGSFANRMVGDSLTWHLESEPVRGRMVVGRHDLSGQSPGPVTPDQLRQMAIQRLQSWGVPPDEIAGVKQRTLMRQDLDDSGQIGKPVLHRHKTFVQRGIHGVRVEGHRAVLTFRPDGVFQRAMAAWPPLAPTGHRLASDLPIPEIEERTIQQLQQAGETGGPVTLHWKYRPQLQADGSVVLELVASARLAEVPGEDLTEEARIFDIPVDAR